MSENCTGKQYIITGAIKDNEQVVETTVTQPESSCLRTDHNVEVGGTTLSEHVDAQAQDESSISTSVENPKPPSSDVALIASENSTVAVIEEVVPVLAVASFERGFVEENVDNDQTELTKERDSLRVVNTEINSDEGLEMVVYNAEHVTGDTDLSIALLNEGHIDLVTDMILYHEVIHDCTHEIRDDPLTHYSI
ncbi:hypothetical protein IFM89_033780 [Coptis chinensis]|uniref:Uncharacterized protein n=1 Tax=Coptis chinensis TaxID=261450 RepID=A0A835LPW7_9MAGN|nr:hypothetical protein IFM89_033780 [Coptis chinensis]